MNQDQDPAEVARLAAEYDRRRPVLKSLAAGLEDSTKELLAGTEHIDRVYFRAKDAASFAKKSLAVDDFGERKYAIPHADIEDQIAGRVLVFFRRDIDVVGKKLLERFNRVEQGRRAPRAHDSFAYESEHFVFLIPPNLRPRDWSSLTNPPTTFEMQVRTLFMHAWAEPQHDIAYKAKAPLTNDEKRKLAWAASTAWGGDAIFEQVLESLSTRNES